MLPKSPTLPPLIRTLLLSPTKHKKEKLKSKRARIVKKVSNNKNACAFLCRLTLAARSKAEYDIWYKTFRAFLSALKYWTSQAV